MQAANAETRRKVEQSPSAEDFARDANAYVTYNPDGSWEARVTGAENIRRAVEMQDGVRAVEIERGARVRDTRVTERIVDATGKVASFPPHIIEQVADKRGWKPKVSWGKPSERWIVRDGELVRVF